MIIEPFDRDFQRIAEMVHWANHTGLASVNLIAAPEATGSESLQTFCQFKLNSDEIIFTLLNDTTTYSAMLDVPDSCVIESTKAAIDLDDILLAKLSPGLHSATYVLTNIKAEGVCEVVRRG
jgi:UDP-glucose:glycoprotein glucosyltransferase